MDIMSFISDNKKRLIAAACAIGGAAALTAGLYTLSLKQKMDSPVFLANTTLNGSDISDLTPRQASDKLMENWAYNNVTVEIYDNIAFRQGTGLILDGPLADYGYGYQKDELDRVLQENFDIQHASLSNVRAAEKNGTEISSDMVFGCDKEKLAKKLNKDNFKTARKYTQDPGIVFNKATQKYEISEGVRGTEIDEKNLAIFVKTEIDTLMNSGEVPQSIKLELPEHLYISRKPASTSPELKQAVEQKNQVNQYEGYEDIKITYTFGKEREVLDFEKIKDWLEIGSDKQVRIKDGKIAEWVDYLIEKYTTRGIDRQFTTSSGETITIPAEDNKYGYVINRHDEIGQLMDDIKQHRDIVREPKYEVKNKFNNPYYYKREGVNDLAAGYIEIDLTKQHIWFYLNGELATEGDIVSGDVKTETETVTGAYPMAYNERGATLEGGSGGEHYEVVVDYWMPFYAGQGLHDAPWREAFGGEIYKEDGSHGCVNLPPEVAKVIFENISPGMPIIIYKS